MKEHIEIEYKVLISKDIFQNILQSYPLHQTYKQTNYYFTHPLFKQKKYMLRIREKRGLFEMTLKRPLIEHHLETNIILTQKEAHACLQGLFPNNEIMNQLKDEGIMPLQLKQQFILTTYRHDILFEDGVLSLDKNEYLDMIDYELEFEVVDEKRGFQHFLNIIQPFDLNYKTNCLSKFARVMQQYQIMNP